ncbi:protein kinase-like protein, putative, partial [Trypanosoma cruzi]
MAEDGDTKQLLRKRRLTAGGASSRTAQRTPTRERRQVIPPDVSGQRWVTTFPSLDAFALQHFILDDRSAAEEEGRMFRAFGGTTWAPRIWNEGVSGVFLDLRGAYNYWKRAEDQAQIDFDNLAVWIGALEVLQDPTDQLMDFDRPLLNTFRTRLTMASDPGIRLSKLRARLYTLLFNRPTPMRGRPSLSSIGEKPSALCDAK